MSCRTDFGTPNPARKWHYSDLLQCNDKVLIKDRTKVAPQSSLKFPITGLGQSQQYFSLYVEMPNLWNPLQASVAETDKWIIKEIVNKQSANTIRICADAIVIYRTSEKGNIKFLLTWLERWIKAWKQCVPIARSKEKNLRRCSG